MYNDIITVKSKGIIDQAALCNKSHKQRKAIRPCQIKA